MIQESESAQKLTEWGRTHLWELEVVLGLRATSVECNLRIAETLRVIGLRELAGMMAMRAGVLMLDTYEMKDKAEAEAVRH